MDEYLIHVSILCCIYLILSLGQQFVLGWAGIFNLAHISTFAIGAYTVALLTVDAQVNFWVAAIYAPIISVIISIPVALLSFRLKTDYFAVGSLAFALVIESILVNWRSLTHGVLGIAGIPRPVIPSISFLGVEGPRELLLNSDYQILTVSVTVVLLCVAYGLGKSSFVAFLKAQSEFEESALSLGINTGFHRMTAFMIASFYGGIAGALFSSYISFIDPTSFALSEMIFVLSILVLSGMRKITGIIGATFFLVLLPEALRFTDIPSSILGPTRQFLYALVLFSVVYLKRESLFVASRKL